MRIKQFFTTINILEPILIILSICSIIGAWKLIVDSGADQIQGEHYRIIYIHVPLAWMSLLSYLGLSITSGLYLLQNKPQFYLLAQSISKVTCLWSILTLITGSLWGKPTWGTYWVFDGRLTSMLVLMLMTLLYIYISKLTGLERFVSYIGLLGGINIPIVKYSVEWWSTLHQPATIRLTETSSSIDITMYTPLMLMWIGIISLTLYLTGREFRNQVQQRVNVRIQSQ